MLFRSAIDELAARERMDELAGKPPALRGRVARAGGRLGATTPETRTVRLGLRGLAVLSPTHEPLIRHARAAAREVTSHEVLMPVVASLAVMLPAALAMMELESLRTGRHRSERVRRAIRRRALLLFTVSASVLAVVINVWPA